MKRTLFLFFLLAVLPLSAWDWSLPPFWNAEDFRNGTELVRYLGPLGEYRKQKDFTLYSFHPFWSYTIRQNELGPSYASDFLWPLFFRRTSWFGETSFYLLYYTSNTGGRRMDYILPFWFSHREPDGAFNWAFFPLYGNMDHFLTYDRIRFCLFPLWWSAKKGTVNGNGWLWPLVSYDAGPHLDRMRIFPFYAYSETKGRQFSRAVLWPFYTMRKSLVPDSADGGSLFWPFWGESRLGTSVSYTVLWPFFSAAFDRKNDSRSLNLPYPLLRFGSTDSGKNTIFFLWPLYGHRKTPRMQYSFFLWPVLWSLERETGKKITVHTWVFPFYWSKSVFRKDYSEKLEESKDFWPLLTYRRKGECMEIQALHLAPRGIRTLDRNLTPLWTFYTYESKGGHYRSDFLWGMFHLACYRDSRTVAVQPFYSYRKKGNSEEYSFFLNLFKKEISGGKAKYRLFYFIEW